MMKKIAISLATLWLVALVPLAQAQAQPFPNRPIRMITTVPPGSVPDLVARLVAKRLMADIGVPVVVENRTGAGGLVGAGAAANAPADGYTILLADTAIFAVLPHFQPQFDPFKTLVPLTSVGTNPLFLAVDANTGVNNVRELIVLAKSKPGLPYGSGGVGGAAHLFMEVFQSAAGVRMTHIPYKGVAPAVQGLLAGEVTTVFSGLNLLEPQKAAGKLRIIGVTARKRVKFMPELPTIREAGLPEFEVEPLIFAFFAPTHTSPDIQAKLREALAASIRAPEVRQRLDELAITEPTEGPPEAIAETLRAEYVRYGKVIKSANIKPE